MAITLDQNLGNASQNNSATTIAMTTTAAVASGARIFVLVNYRNTTALIQSASGGGLSWEILDDTAVNTPSRLAWLSAYAPSGMASSTVITVTLSTNPTAIGNICAVSFTGVMAVSPLDAIAQGTPAGASWTLNINTLTANDLVLGGFTIICNAGPTNVATSGTEIHDFYGGANSRYVITEYLVATAPSTYTISGTITGLAGATQPLESIIALLDAVPTPTASDTPIFILGRGAC